MKKILLTSLVFTVSGLAYKSNCMSQPVISPRLSNLIKQTHINFKRCKNPALPNVVLAKSKCGKEAAIEINGNKFAQVYRLIEECKTQKNTCRIKDLSIGSKLSMSDSNFYKEFDADIVLNAHEKRERNSSCIGATKRGWMIKIVYDKEAAHIPGDLHNLASSLNVFLDEKDIALINDSIIKKLFDKEKN